MTLHKESYNVSLNLRGLPESHRLYPDWDMLKRVGQKALNSVLTGLEESTGGNLKYDEQITQIVEPEYEQLKSNFLTNLLLSNLLARRAIHGDNRFNSKRVVQDNPRMKDKIEGLKKIAHKGMPLWVLDGVSVLQQGGGLKRIEYAENGGFCDDVVHDLSVSAATGRLGFGIPDPSIVPSIERLFETSGHFMFHYHPGAVQEYAMRRLATLHPNKKQVEENKIRVYTRFSGSEVNTVALEIVCDHALRKSFPWGEKQTILDNPEIQRLFLEHELPASIKNLKILELQREITLPKVFAVDGTWAGGHSGAATEATGGGVDKHCNIRTGGEAWVKRNLPLFTRENRDKIIETLSKAIDKGECAGLIIEPDIIADAGIIKVDLEVLADVRKLLEAHDLPIIADCIQTTGSMGDSTYFGEGATKVLGDYKHLIVTNAKAVAVEPLGVMLIPNHVDDSTCDMSHLSTPTYGGPLLQSLVVAEMVQDPEFQEKVRHDSQSFDRIATEYGMTDILRGKGMNRGWFVGENVKYAQLYFYVRYGLLFGRLGEVLRDQRALTEFSETHEMITNLICKGLQELRDGNIPPEIKEKIDDLYSRSSADAGGLNL